MAFFLVTLTLVMFLQIIMRFIFGRPLSWPRGIVQVLFCIFYLFYLLLLCQA